MITKFKIGDRVISRGKVEVIQEIIINRNNEVWYHFERYDAKPQKEDELQALNEWKKGAIVKLKEYDDKGIVIDAQKWGDDMTVVIAWEDGDITIEQCLEDFEIIGDITQEKITRDVRDMVRSRLDVEGML